MIDFTPTKETISLHGLGFIQVKLGGNMRMHVWHPYLPRRSCFESSAVHNHRFSFRSTVMKGNQVNQRVTVKPNEAGEFDIINHNGPRSEKGGRLSFVDGRATLSWHEIEVYAPGDSYEIDMLEYHHTPNNGVVITLLEKLQEGEIHACSTVAHGVTFDQSFDRFQLSSDKLFAYVKEAFQA